MSAMEAALVSTILKIVGTKLVRLVTNEFSSIAGVNKNLEDLQHLVDRINYWLENVEDKAIRNEKSSNWLKPLKDVAYDAEGLVHKFQMEAEQLGVNVVGPNNIVIKYLWTKPKIVVFKGKIAHKIKVIKKRFDVIVKEISDYNTITNSIAMDNHAPRIRKTIGEVPWLTNIDEASIFGRDQLKLKLISELIEPHDQQKIKIVSVIGIGGSGKTTVAKLVYNDGNIIMQHFEEKLWVHVSREFSIEKLVEKLFEAINGDKADHHACQHMSRIISNKLAGKKFLLVLDDVWTEDRLQWEQFMVNIRGGAPGSSILLTTRNRQVAEAVDSTPHVLPFLSHEDSWKVFLKSFGRAMETLDPEFLQVGTDIVKKCAGVPLAIKVLAGVLCRMKRIEDWRSIRANNLLDNLSDVEYEQLVLECLFLSYKHLPHHLKQCFTYCSIFPRGYAMNTRHLISQWIAHGFIELQNQAQQPEEVGSDYFESLLNVGFLQDLKQYRGEETCKMHDLLHDLSRKILQDEFVSEIATTDQIKRCRYLSLTSGTKEVDTKLFDKVRALYVFKSDITLEKPMSKRCCVRTIILDRIRAASLSLFISKFEHLVYLEISNVNCEALPEAISHCWNLQFIHVINCRRLAALPESIGKLKKLRTLELTGLDASTLPQSIGDCSNLQNLYLHDCGLKDIPDSVANIDKLRVLSIADCLKLQVQQMLSSESFGKLCNLRTVTLDTCWDLQCLPQCITSLIHLECLDLEGCHHLVVLPEGIGKLEKLKVLNLQGCNNLCGLPAGFGQMTRLQKLGLFVIGDSTKHARISELENLDKLNGELHITNIKNVNDPCDAEKVHLKKKNGIGELSLDWYSRGHSWASNALEESEMEKELSLDWDSRGHSWARNALEESEMEKDLYLLNSLEPPSEIEKLRISSYCGSQLPRWIMKQSDYCDLGDMHMPEHSNPPQFSHLTELVLENLPKLEHLEGLVHLPGIKILKLRIMPMLLELLTTRTCLAYGDEEVKVQYCFPGLSCLKISECPKLNVKPHFPPSLKRLTLDRSNGQLLSLGSFFLPSHAHGSESAFSSCTLDAKPPHLTELKLRRLIESSSGWNVLWHLTGLRVLKILHCEELRQLPEGMRSLTSLRWLEITGCSNLFMLPDWLGELQSLTTLWLSNLPNVHILPQSIQHLTALLNLHILDCNALTCLPEWVQRLTSLRLLNLASFDALTQLPESLGELSALQSLWIQSCRGLTSLPHSIQRLSALEELNLKSCDALTQLPESPGELSALRSLWIHSCCGLTSLPHSIQRLSALEQLVIFNCPELVKRCKEGVGEDWHLVSHIPNLSIH